MARELRTETNANVVMSASRLVPLRRMATVKPQKAPTVRPLFISERTKRLPQSWRGWAVCGVLLVFDVAPFAFLFWRFV